jgi:hypothetical protein
MQLNCYLAVVSAYYYSTLRQLFSFVYREGQKKYVLIFAFRQHGTQTENKFFVDHSVLIGVFLLTL